MNLIKPSIVADVLVLGAGPGGVATALHLERLGVRAVVLEARDAVATRANVVNMSPDAMASARRAGLGEAFEHGLPKPDTGNVETPVAIRRLEAVGRAELAARGVQVLYGARATGLAHAADGAAAIQLADDHVASGRYVVNATGGRAGFEQDLGMQLRFRGDWGWWGTVRTNPAPGLEEGRAGGSLGMLRNDRPDRHGELRPHFDRLDLPEEVERWRGTSWFGWQHPTDGLSVFQAINSTDFTRFSPAELADRLLAPARAHGAREVLDAPRLIRSESADVAHARVGNVLSVGDAAGRTRPSRQRGTQLAMLDAERAAEAIASALREPARADAILAGYDDATRAAHATFGHDGTRVTAQDPFRGAVDLLELTKLEHWPGAAALG